MSNEEMRELALKAAPGLRSSLGYIDIERMDSDETWADVIVAVLEELGADVERA